MEDLIAKKGLNLKTYSRGQKIQAKIIRKDEKSLLLDIGGKSEGVVRDDYFKQAHRYIKSLKEGDTVSATVVNPEASEGGIVLSLKDAAFEASWKTIKDAMDQGKPVTVEGKNASGKGLAVDFGFISGFIPHSHIGRDHSKNLDSLVDKKFKVKVLELDRKKSRVLFSERAVSDKDVIEREGKALDNIEAGKIYEGTVSQLTDFGAFVKIPVKVKLGKGTKSSDISVEGLVHISELDWEKVESPSQIIAEGDKVKVKVLDVKKGRSMGSSKLSLSLKQAGDDPWETIEERYTKDAKVKGQVVKKSGFGVFVQLEPGVEGLIHITKIPPGTKLEVGQEVNCFVEGVNKKERRLALGLVLTAKPVGYK